MNALFTKKVALSLHTTVLFALGTFPTSLALAQTANTDPPYSIVDRGPFYRVLRRTVSLTNSATGEMSQEVQSFTQLSDGMHYSSNGQWVEAQDLIEVTRTGARAIHGQMTADFNSDITSIGAISLATATEEFQSHPPYPFCTGCSTGPNGVNFCADDYTWSLGDSSYFYFAWCDRSRTFGNAPTNRPDADIKFAKIKQ